jgi:predicted nuclease of restriction endonuclease-like (RecB) superfamily
MRQFYITYAESDEFAKQAVSQIPWGHNIVLLQKLSSNQERLWYAQQTLENGWSRNVLVMQIESNLYARQVSKTKQTNFQRTLPKAQSDLAENVLKDPYVFDFLTIGKGAHEREIERELTTHIRNFLLELGQGFAFVGNQYHLEVGDQDFYIDMLFYHLELRCYVVIELKANKFKPEYTGKLNFYLSVVDDVLKKPEDKPTIGLLLCKDKNKVVADYSLRDVNKPMGVTEYQIIESLPKELKTKLPSIEEIEEELN